MKNLIFWFFKNHDFFPTLVKMAVWVIGCCWIQLLDKRNEERNHIADIIRQEFADKIVATDEENKRIKTEIAELKARQRLEVERIKAEVDVVAKAKDDEMEEVHKR